MMAWPLALNVHIRRVRLVICLVVWSSHPVCEVFDNLHLGLSHAWQLENPGAIHGPSSSYLELC